MSRAIIIEDMKPKYVVMYNKAIVNPTLEVILDRMYHKIRDRQYSYEYISFYLQNDVPWYFIAALHNMESSLNFNRHLHNGDPLTKRTTHVPAGRPIGLGDPPYLFEDSAVDALRMKGLHKWGDWSIGGMLYQMERYNGWGYYKYHSEVNSPYLWSGTNLYTAGKYVSDGKFDINAVSKQIGCVALLKHLEKRKLISLTKK